MDSPEQKNNTYFMDAESAAEMARLIRQDRVMNEAVGGFFPEQPDLSSVHRILDIGCGPGGWALGVAQEHPEIEVVGIDISTIMISYAQSQAQRLQSGNARFKVANALERLDFPDNSFDIINSRLSSGFIPRQLWTTFMQECYRITRPGGIMRLTELDRIGTTTSPAFEQNQQLMTRAYHQLGLGFSPDGMSFGMTPMLTTLLSESGYQDTNYKPLIIDYSYGKPAYDDTRQNTAAGINGIGGLYIKLGLTSELELKRLAEAVNQEMAAESFRALVYQLLAWGKKPL